VPDDLLGVAEIAALLGVRGQTVSVWRRRGQLPAPDVTVKAADLWLRETVVEWAKRTGRMR
jgi:predicted site-specific integrase-resolvase